LSKSLRAADGREAIDRDLPAPGPPKVGAVANAVAILKSLGQTAPAGVNALARSAGVSPSSCYNILKTLVSEGLVDFDPVRKTYAPGAGLYALVPQGADGRAAFARCAPLFERFAEKYAATVALWRIAAAERLVLVGFAENTQATRIHMTVGQRLPMLAGAGGRCIASALNLSAEEIEARFARLRWDNPPSFRAYLRQVAEARTQGWALDDGAFLAGVTTVSVAILDSRKHPTFLIGASFFRGQRPESEFARIGAELKDLADQVTGSLAP
jgi:DNA-binding IclR family transcriptional regulator